MVLLVVCQLNFGAKNNIYANVINVLVVNMFVSSSISSQLFVKHKSSI